ncbi:MAG TPA: pyridoxamine 5'-phosphate oxidase family protein [Pedococcus sp.]|nr:pyridoxamine 5'-phosphate oxidase family protein [Pedococcus sp.]
MDRIQTLSTEECLSLLATASVGRVAMTRDALPVILPVNYVVDGSSVLIRTTEGTILRAARAGGAVVAFEVDELDERTMSGWSVLVTGTLREVTAVSAVLRAEQLPLMPWTGGERRHFVRITPGLLSGRRIATSAAVPEAAAEAAAS